MTLTWKRRASGGLGVYADGAEHRYYVYRMTGRRPWVVKIVRLREGVEARSGAQYDEHNETQALAKAIAQAYEVEPERAAGQATNRLTRAIDRAYRAG